MMDRVKTALEFLKVGGSFAVGELRLCAERPGVIEIVGWTQYTNYANLTKPQCLRELGEIKDIFYKMVDSSRELYEFINAKSLEFQLCYDDNAKGSILLCTEIENRVTWEVKL
ncbi:MAG: hypothetical protein ACK5XN_19700 [Bacteroidota bacterium]|jgi:hypothetical protein